MKKTGLFLIGILILSSCNFEPQFRVEGTIINAEDQMLYLESSAIEGVGLLDSTELKADGKFSFSYKRPGSPEFYRLRILDRVVNFCVDSTETVVIEGDSRDLARGYSVIGSENNQKIKELTLMQIKLQNQVNHLIRNAREHLITNELFEDTLTKIINTYKDSVKINYIYAAPNTASAYFALFQKINDFLVFDPFNNREDIKCFAAVATSLNNQYPHADRSKNLYNIVIKGMKNTRAKDSQTMEIPQEKIIESGLIDIQLKDIDGTIRKLSDLKGQVVLLDFTVYQNAMSAAHNFALRDLYFKYAPQGLEIYQVSLDADEHFWKIASDNLPWICVRDGDGIYSNIAAIYNVKTLPTYFLVNRDNELSARDENIKNLDEELKKLLSNK